jgi:hypothetical protein
LSQRWLSYHVEEKPSIVVDCVRVRVTGRRGCPKMEKLALSDYIRAKESAMLAADTQPNSQRHTSLIPSPQVNVPSSEPSVGDLCASTNSRAGELCVYKENSGNRSFGCFTRDPKKISTGSGSGAWGEQLRVRRARGTVCVKCHLASK